MASPHRQPPPEVGTLIAGFPFEAVVGEVPHGKGKQEVWRLRCSCGDAIEKKAGYLKALEKGNSKARCLNWSINHFPGKIGDRFGRLILRRLESEEYTNGKTGAKSKVLYAYCDCDCGKENIRGTAGSLLKGKKDEKSGWTSCGCKRNEANRSRAKEETGSKEWELYHNAKSRANRRKLPFDIEISDIKIPEYCPVLGILLESNKGGDRMTDASPTLDKFYPKKGYVKGNIHVISWRANRMKSDGTPEDWLKIAEWCQKEEVRRRLEGN